VHTDAADYVRAAPASFDVILVDGFDAAGMPAALGSAPFYADCRRALRDGGVLVANILAYDPAHDALVAADRRPFAGRVCDFPGIAGNNHLLFAIKAAPDAGAARHACRKGSSAAACAFLPEQAAGARARGLAAWRPV
jgi:spermidine synthase